MADEQELVGALELLTSPNIAQADDEVGEIVRDAQQWLKSRNVVGQGVGFKIASGNRSTELSLKVYVERKLPATNVLASERIPATVNIPGLPELITDVEAIGRQRFESFTSATRPVQPAFSIGQFGVGSGTLGCIVARRDAPTIPLLLSNSHVLAHYGLTESGASIVQPASKDGGGEAEVVGNLVKSVNFVFGNGYDNLCDAAIASLLDGVAVNPAVPLIGVPSVGGDTLEPGQLIQKTGKKTGHTTALIKDIHYRTYMSYPMPSGGYGTLGFREQVLCERYSAGGDSGSLICDMAGHAVGLHWCGSDSTSVFSPIEFVFDALDIQLWVP